MEQAQAGTPRPRLEQLVAAELRAELARQHRSRRWLAAAVGLPLTTVARWVKGETAPGLDELDAIAQALGTTVGRLVVEAQRRALVPRPRNGEGRAPVTFLSGAA